MATEDFAGPVDYASFAVAQGVPLGRTLSALHERIQSGAIELLDLEFVSRDPLGNARLCSLTDLNVGSFDATVFEGATSYLLDSDDLEKIAAELTEEDQLAVVIMFEDRCLASVAAQVVAGGGRELFAGGVPIDDLDELLKKVEGEEQ